MIRLRRIEELMASLRDWVMAFWETWTQWDLFLDSDDMKHFLGMTHLLGGGLARSICNRSNMFHFSSVPSFFLSCLFLAFSFCSTGFLGVHQLGLKTLGQSYYMFISHSLSFIIGRGATPFTISASWSGSQRDV